MQRFVIKGGTPLTGEVEINGAKNAILPILAACLLSDEKCILHNVPLLEDVFVMCEILRHYGANVVWYGDTLVVESCNLHQVEPPMELMQKMRASNLILGPLLCRLGEVYLPSPGGCAIGARQMDYHVAALKCLGVHLHNEGSCIKAVSASLRGGKVCLDFPSVGATENALMAAVLAKGESVIYNAAREPEIVDLANFLSGMGAKIRGAGTDIVYIDGVEKLHGVEHTVLADRIEAGTLMIAAAITGGDILLKNYCGQHCRAVISKLVDCGIDIFEENGGLRVCCSERPLVADVKTMPYPGFPTDMQAQYMALLSIAHGTAIVSENIFENRFHHVPEMMRMGADIKIVGDSAVVKGKKCLNGAKVKASDLRAGAALVLLALAADGESYVENVHYIDRGYESFEQTLSSLGAEIKRQTVITSEPHPFEEQLCLC